MRNEPDRNRKNGNSPLASQFPTPEESPGFLLWKASNKLRRLHSSALQELDLTPTQFSILASAIYYEVNSDVPLTQAHLSQVTQMDKMLISDVIRALCLKKFVSKKRHASDKRSFVIGITAKGRKIANQAIHIIEEVDRDFFGALSSMGPLVQQLRTLLE